MDKTARQKAVGNYLVVVLPPIALGLLTGLFLQQRFSWVKPTAAAGLALGLASAVASLVAKQNRLKKITWWLHTVLGLSTASYAVFKPTLVNTNWSEWFGILPGVALGFGAIVLSLVVLGAKDLSRQTVSARQTTKPTPQPQQQTIGGFSERTQVSLLAPRNSETQGVDVTRTLENIGHGAQANLLKAANQSRQLDLDEIKFISNLAAEQGHNPADWPEVTRLMVKQRFGEELSKALETPERTRSPKERQGIAKKQPQPVIGGWGYGGQQK